MKITNATVAILATASVLIVGMLTFLVYSGRDTAALIGFILTGSLNLITLIKVNKVDSNVNGHMTDLRNAAGLGQKNEGANANEDTRVNG